MKKLLALLCMSSLAFAGDKMYEKTNIPPSVIHVLDGVDKTGVTDTTAALITFFQQGGYLFIPDGDYLIANAGPAAGGVYAELTKAIQVECGPKAILHGTNLDHDMINFTVPAGGTGLPTGGIKIVWHGCTFDQTTQKTSTSVPFSATYTSTNQGTSGNTDGLDITGGYTITGTTYSGIYYAEISGATFRAGTHWQNAGSGSGGDSGSGCEAVTLCEYHHNSFFGNRDSGIYTSQSSTGTLTKVRVDIHNNYFENGFGCATVKRSTQGFSIHDNTCIGAVVGFSALWIVGGGSAEGDIHNNRCSGCQINDKVQYATNLSIHDEKCDNFGAYLANGTSVPATYTATGFELEGLSYSKIYNNTCTSISATYAALNPYFITLTDYAGNSTASTNNILEHNVSIGFHQAGIESGSADYNEFYENYEWTGTFPYFSASGTHSSHSYMDYATGIRYHRNPQAFIDGTAAAPTIARLADVTTGIYFGTGSVNLSAGGVEQARLTSTTLSTDSLTISTVGSTPLSVNSSTATDQVYGTGPAGSTRMTGRFSADVTPPANVFLKSRHTTAGSFATIVTGDCIGKNIYYADDGATYSSEAGEFGICSTGTIATGKIPGQFVLKLADSNGSLTTPFTGTSAGMSTPFTFTSTLATGTAPFTVASTTNVANLNASTLSGATFASPGAIGGTVASTALFTTIGASGLITPTSTVGIKGTVGADAPAAGSVGEMFNVNCFMGAAAAAGSAVSLPVASPGVVTWASHTFTSTGATNYSCPINFTAGAGALPTGVVAGTTYYIIGSSVSGDTFQISDTMAHALAGTNAINFTGSFTSGTLGFIGYLISTGNTVGTAGLTVTAGDWDCSATATSQELTALTVTEFLTAINTSAAIGTVGSYADFRIASNALGAANSSYVSPLVQENVSASTTVFAVSKAAFSAGTQNIGAFLRCRRMR